MTETEEEVKERTLENTREILKILDRMNQDNERALKELDRVLAVIERRQGLKGD